MRRSVFWPVSGAPRGDVAGACKAGVACLPTQRLVAGGGTKRRRTPSFAAAASTPHLHCTFATQSAQCSRTSTNRCFRRWGGAREFDIERCLTCDASLQVGNARRILGWWPHHGARQLFRSGGDGRDTPRGWSHDPTAECASQCGSGGMLAEAAARYEASCQGPRQDKAQQWPSHVGKTQVGRRTADTSSNTLASRCRGTRRHKTATTGTEWSPAS